MSSSGQFKCEPCGAIFNSNEELEKHAKEEHQK